MALASVAAARRSAPGSIACLFVLIIALSASRTPVYPAILRVTRAIGGDYALLPYVQFSLSAFSAIVLFLVAQVSGFKPWEALLISAPLAVAGILWEYTSQMMTEVVTVSVFIAAAALTLLIAARGPTIGRNILLAVAITAASLSPPAFLFLVLTCPLAIFLVSPGLRSGTTLRYLLGQSTCESWMGCVGGSHSRRQSEGLLHPLSASGAVTKGRLLGTVYPLFTCFACAAMSVSVFWSRLVKGKPSEVSELQRAIAFCTIALLFLASGMLLVSFVEMPLKRYILAVSPLLPGAILLVSVEWALRA
ncbi:MAG: hypothetical protein ABJC63_08490 [Gemmatimonadales bacterium]